MTKRYARVERRRAQDRARIITTAATMFAEAGPDGVRLDDIGKAADVARATLYSHFESKDALLAAIARPLIEEGILLLQPAVDEPDAAKAVEQLLDVYLILHRKHSEALRVSYLLQGRPLGELARPHRRFLQIALSVLERAAAAHLLRSEDPALAARALARLAVPTLEVFQQRPDLDQLFKASMRGFLLRS